MEERTQSFDEKLTLLLEEAKKKKNVLENREILDFFKGEILDPDKLDRIYDFLDNHHVDVLRTEEEDIDPDLFLVRSCGMKIKLLLLKDWRQPIMRGSVKEVSSKR